MKRNEIGLDEMQIAYRDKIGNQSFMLTLYLIMLDVILNGIGFKWLSYPSNIWVICMISVSVYFVRLIAANAYLPAKAKNTKTVIPLAVSIIIGCVIAAILFYGKQPNPSTEANARDHSALILFFISAAGLIVGFVVMIIKQVRSKNKQDE